MTDLSPPESDLVRRAHAGDRAAFSALYDTYFDRIYDFCYQMSRNRDDAADLVSEVFLKAMERLSSLNDAEAFKGWLYAIARNASLNQIGRRGRTAAMPDDYDPVPPPGTPAPPDPSDIVSERDLSRLVWDAAATLNQRDYSIFDMTVRQGLDSAEVAEALGVKKSHAYVLVSRLKDTVEEALSAVVLARAGRRECDTLDAIVSGLAGEVSPRLRRTICGHLKTCEDCQRSRKRYASAAALLGGVASATPTSGLKEEIARDLELLWPHRGPGSVARGSRLSRAARIGTVPAILAVFAILSVSQPTAPEMLAGRLPWPVRAVDTTPRPRPAPAPVSLAEPTPGSAEPDETAQPERTPDRARAPTPIPTPARTVAAPGPSVTASIYPAVLFDGACGPRTATVTATVSARAGVRSVRLQVQIGGSTTVRPMQGSGDTFRAGVGPFDNPGTFRYQVTLVDGNGSMADSGARTATVQQCQQTPATPPPPTPLTPTPTPTPTPQRPIVD